MTTITKFIVIIITSILLSSCNFDLNMGPGVRGNGNVMTIDRELKGDFNSIKVSAGMNVYLTQSDSQSVVVEADENLHELISTRIEDGVLKITSEGNIRSSKALKVMVQFDNVDQISAHSGSDVYATNTITADYLKLSTDSGADMEVDVITTSLHCSTSSGSDLVVTGKTEDLKAEASSGSDLQASSLMASTCSASASSGADISVNSSKKLIVKANSGGDVNYFGNPETIVKNGVTSGSIQQQ